MALSPRDRHPVTGETFEISFGDDPEFKSGSVEVAVNGSRLIARVFRQEDGVLWTEIFDSGGTSIWMPFRELLGAFQDAHNEFERFA